MIASKLVKFAFLFVILSKTSHQHYGFDLDLTIDLDDYNNCGKMPQIVHGSYDHSERLRHRWIVCQRGYELVGPNFIACQSGGRWTQPGRCVRANSTKLCDSVPFVANGHVATGSNYVGSKRDIICNTGYRFEVMESSFKNSDGAVCGRDGKWHYNGQCVKNRCGPVPSFFNGYISDGGSNFGSERFVGCRKGILVNGTGRIICKASGFWSHPGECSDRDISSSSVVTCGGEPTVRHGYVYQTDYENGDGNVPGAVRQFVCDEGFVISGRAEFICERSGKWEPQGACRRVVTNCQNLPPVANGYFEDGSSAIGAIRYLYCYRPEMQVFGPYFVECLPGGRWSRAGTCQTPTTTLKTTQPTTSTLTAARRITTKATRRVFTSTARTTTRRTVAPSTGAPPWGDCCTNTVTSPDLIRAAQDGNLTAIKNLLYSRMTDSNTMDAQLRTPLMFAAQGRCLTCIDELLNCCADIDWRSANGWTALMFATQAYQTLTVDKLLKLGANVSLQEDQQGKTALMIAVESKRRELVRVFVGNNLKTMPSVNVRDVNGKTALMRAVEGGDRQMVELLLLLKPDLQIRENATGLTALSLALRYGHEDIANILASAMEQDRGMFEAVTTRRSTSVSDRQTIRLFTTAASLKTTTKRTVTMKPSTSDFYYGDDETTTANPVRNQMTTTSEFYYDIDVKTSSKKPEVAAMSSTPMVTSEFYYGDGATTTPGISEFYYDVQETTKVPASTSIPTSRPQQTTSSTSRATSTTTPPTTPVTGEFYYHVDDLKTPAAETTTSEFYYGDGDEATTMRQQMGQQSTTNSEFYYDLEDSTTKRPKLEGTLTLKPLLTTTTSGEFYYGDEEEVATSPKQTTSSTKRTSTTLRKATTQLSTSEFYYSDDDTTTTKAFQTTTDSGFYYQSDDELTTLRASSIKTTPATVRQTVLPKCCQQSPTPRANNIALVEAAKAGNATAVLLELTNGNGDPNSRNGGYGWTALMYAAFNNHSEVVKVLLDCCAMTELRNDDGSTALYLAAEAGSLKSVDLLISYKANVNAENFSGSSALLIAAQNGFAAVVAKLLQNRANVEHVNDEGNSALFAAVINGHLETARILLQNGANTSRRDSFGLTALDLAQQAGHQEMAKLLLSFGAKSSSTNAIWTSTKRQQTTTPSDEWYIVDDDDQVKSSSPAFRNNDDDWYVVDEVEVDDDDDWYIVDDEAVRSNSTAQRFYFKSGGQQSIATDKNMTIATTISSNNSSSTPKASTGQATGSGGCCDSSRNKRRSTELLEATKRGDLSAVKVELLSNNADPNTKDEISGNSALMFAVLGNHSTIAVALLDCCIDVNLANAFGETALLVAARNERLVGMSKLLLGHGANPNLTDFTKSSPLIAAARNGNVKTVEVLLEHDANANLQDSNGFSALIWAVAAGHSDVIELLLNSDEINVDLMTESTQETALMMAAEAGETDMVAALVEHGADVGILNADGKDAVALAAENGHAGLAEFLLVKTSSLNVKKRI